MFSDARVVLVMSAQGMSPTVASREVVTEARSMKPLLVLAVLAYVVQAALVRAGPENRLGKRGDRDASDWAGRRRVTRLNRKVVVADESLPCRASAAELSLQPCVKPDVRRESSSIGACNCEL